MEGGGLGESSFQRVHVHSRCCSSSSALHAVVALVEESSSRNKQKTSLVEKPGGMTHLSPSLGFRSSRFSKLTHLQEFVKREREKKI